MNVEKNRLASFKNWPSKAVKPEHLAEAGFFYTGNGDRVECFTCGCAMIKWEDDDKPFDEHLKWLNGDPTRCSFMEEALMSNIQPSTHRQNRSNNIPIRPDFTKFTDRLHSFVPPWPESSPVTPRDLAEACFFYTGSSDMVMCPFCKGKLHSWSQNDNPLTEHKTHYKCCPFILLLKVQSNQSVTTPPVVACHRPGDSQRAVHQSCTPPSLFPFPRRDQHAPYQSEHNRLGPYQSASASNSVPLHLSAEEGASYTASNSVEPGQHHPLDDEPQILTGPRSRHRSSEEGFFVMDHEPSSSELAARNKMEDFLHGPKGNTMVEMGYSRDVILQALKRVLARNVTTNPTLDLVIDTVEELNTHTNAHTTPTHRKHTSSPATVTQQNTAHTGNDVTSQQTTVTPTAPTGDDELTSGELRRLADENARMRAERECKICMDHQVEVVFEPCHHMCCCTQCSYNITNCPICRRRIFKTIKPFY